MAHFDCFTFGNDSSSSILKSSQTSPCLDMATKHVVSGFQVLWFSMIERHIIRILIRKLGSQGD